MHQCQFYKNKTERILTMKTIKMSHEQAQKIFAELVKVLPLLFNLTPPYISTSYENARTKITTFKILSQDEDKIFAKKRISYSKPDEYTIKFSNCGKLVKVIYHLKSEFRLDIIYKIIIGNRCFEITLYKDPDACGYCSMYPDPDGRYVDDSSPYVLCNIIEERSNGKKKYEMIFGFDIEKKTFLELFELIHYTATDVVREYWDSRLEAELRDTELF